jgi:cardiolipin synthase
MKSRGRKSKTGKSIILQNIPNALSIARIVFAFVVIYMIFTRQSIASIVFIFAIAALTDWIDGKLARKFNWTSEFGRRTDMIADRFLWAGTAIAFIIVFGLDGRLRFWDGIQLLLIMSREIITMPFALIAFFSGSALPHARYIAKVTTALQGFAMPALILSIEYPMWLWLSVPVSIVCAVTGFYSAMYYIKDTRKLAEDKEKKQR